MKSKLYLLLLVPVLTLASCKKWTIADDSNRIVGNWQISYVERQGNYGSEPVYTGYEGGEFYFSNNGSARFSVSYGEMNGSWRMIPRSDGYNGGSNSLELRLYDYYNDDAIEWEFYAVEFTGNRMIGYMNRYGYEYRYEFRRY